MKQRFRQTQGAIHTPVQTKTYRWDICLLKVRLGLVLHHLLILFLIPPGHYHHMPNQLQQQLVRQTYLGIYRHNRTHLLAELVAKVPL
jgi:hypothetical protein